VTIVKISDISELMVSHDQTKILGNQLVHESSSCLSDSVKNADSSSAGWQEWGHNTPDTSRQCQVAHGTLAGVAFGVARLPKAALGIRGPS
jgi:hypothetical protein